MDCLSHTLLPFFLHTLTAKPERKRPLIYNGIVIVSSKREETNAKSRKLGVVRESTGELQCCRLPAQVLANGFNFMREIIFSPSLPLYPSGSEPSLHHHLSLSSALLHSYYRCVCQNDVIERVGKLSLLFCDYPSN